VLSSWEPMMPNYGYFSNGWYRTTMNRVIDLIRISLRLFRAVGL
jgi:hypothetical protein